MYSHKVAARLLVVWCVVLAVLLSTALASAALPAQLPPSGGKFDYQLGGATKPAPGVRVVVRDRQDPIARGVFNICYINGFQTQPHERAFWRKHRSLLLNKNGKLVVDAAWGETLLDIRTAKKRNRLAKIMDRWVAGCQRAGFKAVEFDNLDSFLRSKKLIKRSHTKSYAKLLTRSAHRHGLTVGQKNWAEFNGRTVGFDFALVESCGRYRECASYTKNFGRNVFAIEYRKRDFRWTCKHFGKKISVVFRDVLLKPRGPRAWC